MKVAGGYYLGVDMGATNTRVVLIESQGTVLARKSRPTGNWKGTDQGFKELIDHCKLVTDEAAQYLSNISAFGLGCPGIVDDKRKVIKGTTIPGKGDLPLASMVEDELGMPAYVENDANVAALAEYHFGAGKGAESLVCITLGTGIGCGIVLGGEIVRGASFAAGEVGAWRIAIIKDGNQETPNLEALASGLGIAEQAARILKSGKPTMLVNLARRPGGIAGKTVYEAALQGDKVARQVLDDAACYLGLMLGNVISLVNPEMVVLSSGMAQENLGLLEKIGTVARQVAFPTASSAVRIVPSRLGDDVGAIGAAALAIACVSSGEELRALQNEGGA